MPESRYSELSLSAQTAYAELFDVVRAQSLQRSVAHLNGSFGTKLIKGKLYWYFQYRDISGQGRQLYVGPDSERIQALIKQAHETPLKALEPLARSALALGCEAVLPKHFRIIRRLSEYGFFHAGGVLIGTHAFLTMGNMLGVRWTEGSRTQDVDFAHAGRNISIALPANVQVDANRAFQSLEVGFLPLSAFDGEVASRSLNPQDPGLRLDFLTTLHRGKEKPFTPPNLNVALQPLKFMEFSLEQTTQATLFCEEGAVLVNVPSPIRYALHKLLVWGEREEAYRVKASKDLVQAAAIIDYFRKHRAHEINETWADLMSRGKGWRQRATQGAKALARLDPELAAVLG